MAYTLRVSVIDNCQLRCGYCLPDGPHQLLAKQHYLTIEQYQRAARAMRHFGIEKIRFTGGEPLLRKDLPAIIRAFADVHGCPLGLTTNGLRFVGSKDALIDAGLTMVTFHLDTLKEERYQKLMGRGSVAAVRDALASACDSSLVVKLNVVVQKGLNDDELVDFLMFSKATGIAVRFIEQMNTGSAKDHVARTFMSGAEILAALSVHAPVMHRAREDVSAPAERLLSTEIGVEFGLIASDTRPFCANCNRLRLNADGRMRTCLYEPKGFDVGLKNALSDAELVRNITAVIGQKRSFHPAVKTPRVDFAMAQIGG